MNDKWLNRPDIEYAKEQLNDHPILGPAARFLDAYKELLDDISDGWSSWAYGTKCAADLCIIVGNAAHALTYRHEMAPTKAQVDAACQKVITFLKRCGQTKGNEKVLAFLQEDRLSSLHTPLPPPTITIKAFKVASLSDNNNSFGLKGHILVARDGEAWQAGKSAQFAHKKGDVVTIHYRNGDPDFASAGFEIPERISTAPMGIVGKVWGN